MRRPDQRRAHAGEADQDLRRLGSSLIGDEMGIEHDPLSRGQMEDARTDRLDRADPVSPGREGTGRRIVAERAAQDLAQIGQHRNRLHAHDNAAGAGRRRRQIL